MYLEAVWAEIRVDNLSTHLLGFPSEICLKRQSIIFVIVLTFISHSLPGVS